MKQLLSFSFLLLSCFSIHSQETDYPQVVFDSDSCCWRKLARSGYYEKAADLVVDYLAHGKPQNRQSLKWHAGQLYAQAGNRAKALRYFRKSSTLFDAWLGGEEGKTWRLYVNGVKAFLNRDRAKLQRSIAIWERKFPKDRNYHQLLLLDKNWDKSYLEATL